MPLNERKRRFSMTKITNSISTDFLHREKWIILGIGSLFLTYIILILLVHDDSALRLQVILNGLVLSTIYSVIALGFSLIYGIAKQLKLSLGGYYVLAAYIMFFFIEVKKINTSFDNLGNIDGLVIFLMGLIPFFLIIMFAIIFWNIFNKHEFFYFSFAGILTITGYILVLFIKKLVNEGEITEGLFRAFISELLTWGLKDSLYAGTIIFILILTAWYLEFSIQRIYILSYILGILIPIFFFLNLPVGYLSLMILAVSLTSFVAMLSDRYLLEKVRKSHINVMIMTFSLALFLQSIINLIYFPSGGTELVSFGDLKIGISFPPIVPTTKSLRIYGAIIMEVKVIAFFFVIFAVILLYLFIWKTKIGMALRAVSQDEEAAALTGIDIRKTTAIVSAIGMGLIAFAAVLTSPFSAKPQWSPGMGWWILIMAIAIVTLGGLGSLPGSIISAFIIGFAEVIVSSIPDISAFASAIPLIIVLIVMIIKPEGLMGEKKELEA